MPKDIGSPNPQELRPSPSLEMELSDVLKMRLFWREGEGEPINYTTA